MSPSTLTETAFTLDPATRQITISASLAASQGSYFLRVSAKYLDDGLNFFTYTVTLEDPCMGTSLTIQPDILDSLSLNYILWSPDSYVHTLDISKIDSTAEFKFGLKIHLLQ